MLLLELAAQGLKGAALPAGSVRLRPGYAVVAADGGVLRRLVAALLRPSPRDPERLLAVAGARAGLTFVGDDGATYRLLRDFSGSSKLGRLDPQRRIFVPVDEDAPGEGGACAAATASANLLELLTLSSSSLPSRRVGSGRPTVPVVLPRAEPGRDPAARRAELRAELDRARVAEQLQERLNAAQSQLLEVEQALREEARLREAAGAAQRALQGAEPVARASERLGDARAKLEGHAKALGRLEEALARCASDGAELDLAGQGGKPPGFWRLPSFWAGVGAGAAAVVAAVAGASVAPGLRYLALLDVPALGWSASVALSWVNAEEEYGRRIRRRQLVEEYARKARVAFDRETAEVQAAVKQLGLAAVSELREALAQLSSLRAAAAAAGEVLTAHLVRPGTRSAQALKATLEAEVQGLEARLASAGETWTRDPRSVEAELQRLESEPAAPGESAPHAGRGVSLEDSPGAREGGEAVSTDPFLALLAAAARALGGSPTGAARGVAPRAGQLLQALAGGRLSALGVDDRGNVLLSTSGRPAPVASAPLADRDLAFIALVLAFWEELLPRRFALVDDALAVLPESARQVAGRLLKQLAHRGQVIHCSLDPAFRAAADHLA